MGKEWPFASPRIAVSAGGAQFLDILLSLDMNELTEVSQGAQRPLSMPSGARRFDPENVT